VFCGSAHALGLVSSLEAAAVWQDVQAVETRQLTGQLATVGGSILDHGCSEMLGPAELGNMHCLSQTSASLTLLICVCLLHVFFHNTCAC
jgi:hypothetical protein